jgi:hypothetical protein
MPKNGPTKAELNDALSQIAELAEEALDPENSREDIVRKLKDIAELAGDPESEDKEETEDEEYED